LILNVNEGREQSQEVKLGARETHEVVFSITKNNPGTYNVMIDNLTGGFIVTESAMPPQLHDETSWFLRYWWIVLISAIAITFLISILWFRK